MDELFFQLTFFLYVAATAGFIVHLISLRNGVEKIAVYILSAGFCLHTIAIILRWISEGHVPLVSFHDTFSFLAWAITLAFLLFQAGHSVRALGAFVSPVISVMMAAGLMHPRQVLPLPPALKSYWLPVHATICLVSYALLTLAFCIAIMYLVQERQIKRKKLGAIFRRLPSLETLDTMSERCLKIGFPLLTLGIITGSMWAESAWGSYWSWDPKETWSLITWFLYAALLHQRLTVGWRGRKSAYMTIIGYVTLLFTFIGVTYLLPGAHSYAL
ncbi:MAG: c-type cytochrome biogenesis protein CcsB [Thermodesulfatator sp.]|nr:MAG: c-type cytochrome biogenesis protein CcsB [Thermodesulfatator sp.]